MKKDYAATFNTFTLSEPLTLFVFFFFVRSAAV